MGTGLSGKVVITAGATANIGRAIVLAFAKEGVRVAVVGRDCVKGEEVARLGRECGAIDTMFHAADVTDRGAVEGRRQLEQACKLWHRTRVEVLIGPIAKLPPYGKIELWCSNRFGVSAWERIRWWAGSTRSSDVGRGISAPVL